MTDDISQVIPIVLLLSSTIDSTDWLVRYTIQYLYIMSEGGHHEIDAAKKRLAAAKATASSASTMASSAHATASSASKMMDSAKSMELTARIMAATAKKNKAIAESLLKISSKEVEEANKLLKEVEKKWEVVDVDADDSPKKNDSKKRRKVSATNTQANNTNENSNSTGQNETAGAVARPANIVVEGAGLASVNGPYGKFQNKMNGFDCYGKVGQWDGTPGKFIIYCIDSHWYLGFFLWTSNLFQRELYRTMNSCHADIPLKNGWMTIGEGVSPAPKLNW